MSLAGWDYTVASNTLGKGKPERKVRVIRSKTSIQIYGRNISVEELEQLLREMKEE